MQKYICTRDWRDLTDRHLYHAGDPFPCDGREVPADRLQELESGRNRAGLQMIQGIVTEDAPKPAQAPDEKPVKKAPARRAAAKKK